MNIEILVEEDAVSDLSVFEEVANTEAFSFSIYTQAHKLLLEISNREEKDVCCVVIDIRKPTLSCYEFYATLHQKYRSVPVILLTIEMEVPLIIKAMQVGDIALVSQEYISDGLVDCIENAIKQRDIRVQTEKEKQSAKLELSKVSLLTPREQEVLKELAKGNQNKQVACSLGISIKTVEMHRSHLRQKLGANSSFELARYVDVAAR